MANEDIYTHHIVIYVTHTRHDMMANEDLYTPYDLQANMNILQYVTHTGHKSKHTEVKKNAI